MDESLTKFSMMSMSVAEGSIRKCCLIEAEDDDNAEKVKALPTIFGEK